MACCRACRRNRCPRLFVAYDAEYFLTSVPYERARIKIFGPYAVITTGHRVPCCMYAFRGEVGNERISAVWQEVVQIHYYV